MRAGAGTLSWARLLGLIWPDVYFSLVYYVRLGKYYFRVAARDDPVNDWGKNSEDNGLYGDCKYVRRKST